MTFSFSFRFAVKVLALVKEPNGRVVRPTDIKPEIAGKLVGNFEAALTASSVLSVKGQKLVAIDMTTTKVVRKNEAFTCPLAIQVSYTDMEDFNAAVRVAFDAAFPGKYKNTSLISSVYCGENKTSSKIANSA